MSFVQGSVVSFIVLLAYCIGTFLTVRAYQGKSEFPIKRLKGLDFIDDALGRVTEMGRPAHFSMGSGELDAQYFAAFEYLRYIAQKAARYDADLIVTNAIPEVQPVTEEIVRSAYVNEGKPDRYKPDNIRYVSVYALRPAVLGTFQREQVAANFMLGNYYHESVIFVEAASSVGAISVGGTTQTAQIPFFVAGADYTLIGEEFYAGSIALSGNVTHFGCLAAQEGGKYLAIILMLVGAIMATGGNDALIQLMKK
ncbi:MAG: DUF6754 domain-containing protein [Bacillota bacterium]